MTGQALSDPESGRLRTIEIPEDEDAMIEAIARSRGMTAERYMAELIHKGLSRTADEALMYGGAAWRRTQS